MDNNLITTENERQYQFYGLLLILLIIGFLNYFRKIMSGVQGLEKRSQKLIYIFTMVIFTTGTMFLLYFTNLNNIASFLIGLLVTTLSENLAQFLLKLQVNFDAIAAKFIYRYTKVDITPELKDKYNNQKEDDSENK